MLNYLVADSGPGYVERSGKAVYYVMLLPVKLFLFSLTNLSGLVNLVFPFFVDNSKRNVLFINVADV